MSCTLNVTSEPAFLPLRDAVLCRDCEFISGDAGDMCSVCGSRSLVRVSELMKSKPGSASVNAKGVFPFFGLRLGAGIGAGHCTGRGS